MSISKNRTVGSWIALVVFLNLTSTFLCPAIGIVFNNTLLLINGVKTKAEIISCNNLSNGDSGTGKNGYCKSMPKLKFSVNNGDIHYFTPSSSTGKLKIGDQINIIYDKNNFKRVHSGELNHPFTAGATILLILSLPFLLLTLLIYSVNTFDVPYFLIRCAFLPHCFFIFIFIFIGGHLMLNNFSKSILLFIVGLIITAIS